MHKIWRLGSDGITREVHPTAQIDIGAGTMGQFSYDYLAENGWRIPILGQISINGSVKMLGIPNLCRTSGPMFIENLLALILSVGVIRTGSFPWGGAYSMWSVPCSSFIPAHPTYMPRSPENARADACRVCDNSLCSRRCACTRSPPTSCNPVRNLSINSCGDDWEGPVDQ